MPIYRYIGYIVDCKFYHIYGLIAFKDCILVLENKTFYHDLNFLQLLRRRDGRGHLIVYVSFSGKKNALLMFNWARQEMIL